VHVCAMFEGRAIGPVGGFSGVSLKSFSFSERFPMKLFFNRVGWTPPVIHIPDWKQLELKREKAQRKRQRRR
jgi:hypothetical protein